MLASPIELGMSVESNVRASGSDDVADSALWMRTCGPCVMPSPFCFESVVAMATSFFCFGVNASDFEALSGAKE